MFFLLLRGKVPSAPSTGTSSSWFASSFEHSHWSLLRRYPTAWGPFWTFSPSQDGDVLCSSGRVRSRPPSDALAGTEGGVDSCQKTLQEPVWSCFSRSLWSLVTGVVEGDV